MPIAPDMPLWIFGYGSLIWNPEFPVAEQRLATLRGWRRRFCMWSIHHRGTPRDPGLVLALDAEPGAVCRGVAFRVPDAARGEALERLRRRELVSSAYHETVLPVELDDGEMVQAVAYVMDRDHAQYSGHLTAEEQARIIARATGGLGPNRDYLLNTVRHLDALGIGDPELETLARLVHGLTPG